jgi:hypothetical protein
MNTFTAQELADFYQQVADGGEIEVSLIVSRHFEGYKGGPNLSCLKDSFSIKPTKKVINLSVLIDSQIDCEFFATVIEEWIPFGALDVINELGYEPKWSDEIFGHYGKCRPRMNHIHAWQSGECPLPEGFEVKVWYRDDLRYPDTLVNSGVYTNTGWVHRNNGRDIIHFQVLRVAEGYVMPYDKESE